MLKSFFIAAIVFVITACGNGEQKQSTLNEAPYAALTDSIEQSPKNAELHYKRGILLYEKGEAALAKTDIEKAWSLAGKEEYALSLARLLGEKNPDSAIVFLEGVIPENERSIALKISLAKAYVAKKDLSKALELCNALITAYAGGLDALLLKAEILSQQEKWTEATTVLEQAYTLAPFDAELAHNLAYRYAEAKNSKVLLLADSLQKADVQNIHAEPLLFKGIYYYNIKNYNTALQFFDKAIVKDYAFLDAHMYKGQTLFDQKKYTDAAKTFRLVTTISPTYAEGYYWLAKTNEAEGDKAEAKLNYQRSIGLDKTLTEAKAATDRL